MANFRDMWTIIYAAMVSYVPDGPVRGPWRGRRPWCTSLSRRAHGGVREARI